MDQVRVALTWLKEQHFWVLTVLTLIVALTCWYLAAGELQKQFKANKSKIDSEFSAQQSRRSQPFHANDDVNQRTEEEIKLLADKVEQIWTQLYERQREEVLKWPAQLDNGVDPNGASSFLRHVSDKSFGEFIGNDFRDRYLNYIQKRFPDLPKIIKALEVDDATGRMPQFDGGGEGGGFGAGGPGGFGRGGQEEFVEEKEFLVVWRDQLAVKQQLVMGQRPSAIRIWVTQEDLWVYEALLKAIANTNTAASADRYRNAAVREIYQLDVGVKASGGDRTQPRIFQPSGDTGAAAGGMGGGGFGEGGGFGGGGPDGFGEGGGGFGGGGFGGPGGFGEAGGEADGELATLLTNRYVDDQGQPVPAPTTVTPGQPIQIGSSEYKQLPIRLVLKMDQRWLPRVIVELANAPLQVVINEVRINPTGDVASGGAGGPGGGGGGFGGGAVRTQLPRALQLAGRAGGSGGGGRFSGGFGGGGGLGQNAEVFVFPREPNIATVVLNGTVLIFNPPDPAVLSVGDDGIVASNF